MQGMLDVWPVNWPLLKLIAEVYLGLANSSGMFRSVCSFTKGLGLLFGIAGFEREFASLQGVDVEIS